MQRFLLLLLIIQALTGCDSVFDDLTRIDEVRSTPEFAVPLVDSRINLAGLVGEIDDRVTLTIDPDGLLRFNYRDTVPPVTSDLIFDELRNLARGLPLVVTKRRQALPFPFPDEVRIDELRAKSGSFTYDLPNTYDRPVTVQLTLPNAVRNGQVLTVSGTLPAYSGSGDVPRLTNVDQPLDFAGYTLDLSSDSLIVEYRIDGTDGTALQPARGTAAAFSNLEFDYIEGYFGRQAYPGVSGTLDIEFFDNYLGGDIRFLEPRITVGVNNNFGIPARAIIDRLDVTTVDGGTVAVTGEIVEEGFVLDYPGEPGTSIETTYLINETNSNVGELIAAKPVRLNYRISALINPAANREITGFLTDTSTYTATINVELPLYGAADDFGLRDSFPINLGDDYGEITEATFRITTDNAIPFDLTLTGTFVDSLGNELLDLSDGQLMVIGAGTVDANGQPTATQQVMTDIAFASGDIDLLRQSAYLVLNTSFATTDAATEEVRILDTQQLRVRVGARLTVNNP